MSYWETVVGVLEALRVLWSAVARGKALVHHLFCKDLRIQLSASGVEREEHRGLQIEPLQNAK